MQRRAEAALVAAQTAERQEEAHERLSLLRMEKEAIAQERAAAAAVEGAKFEAERVCILA